MNLAAAAEPGISVVIPAWNEEARLGQTLERYLPAFEAFGKPFEVMVVVDGAGDHTDVVAERYAPRGVRVLHYPTKLGKGGAVLEGMRAARFDWVGYLDADGPIPPSDAMQVIRGLDHTECSIASRSVPGAKVVNPEPLPRRVAGRLWSALVRGLMFIPVRDTQCGAKFFRSASVRPVLSKVLLTNWAFDVSLLYHLRRNGSRIAEQPVTWSHDTGSHLVLSREAPIMFLSLVGLRLSTLRISKRLPRDWIVRVAKKFRFS